MEQGQLMKTSFLCLLNALLMIAGMFLNSVVIISLWRSSQLRKKLCYFMILVLSCFDLALVIIMHPFLISSAIYISIGDYDQRREQARIYISLLLNGFLMFSLLTLNIERFLALAYPYFHQRSVTKERLLYFLSFLLFSAVVQATLSFQQLLITENILVTVYLSVFLVLFIFMNYKMFIIAKSKRKHERVAPIEAELTNNEERKGRSLDFKNISTRILAVACFFACSSPQIVYSVLHLTSQKPLYGEIGWEFKIWSSTFFSMNSTFNSMIFFWKNSVLRREGIKILKCLQSERSRTSKTS